MKKKKKAKETLRRLFKALILKADQSNFRSYFGYLWLAWRSSPRLGTHRSAVQRRCCKGGKHLADFARVYLDFRLATRVLPMNSGSVSTSATVLYLKLLNLSAHTQRNLQTGETRGATPAAGFIVLNSSHSHTLGFFYRDEIQHEHTHSLYCFPLRDNKCCLLITHEGMNGWTLVTAQT